MKKISAPSLLQNEHVAFLIISYLPVKQWPKTLRVCKSWYHSVAQYGEDLALDLLYKSAFKERPKQTALAKQIISMRPTIAKKSSPMMLKLVQFVIPVPVAAWLCDAQNVLASKKKNNPSLQVSQNVVLWHDQVQGFYFNGAASLSYNGVQKKFAKKSGLTFAAWIKTQPNNNLGFRIISNRYGLGHVCEFVVPRYNSHVTSFFVEGKHFDVGATPVCDNQWHHVVIVVEQQRLVSYVDGACDGTVTINCSNLLQGFDPHYSIYNVGCDHANSAGHFYQGYLKEVCMWDVALTAEQVCSVYKLNFM